MLFYNNIGYDGSRAVVWQLAHGWQPTKKNKTQFVDPCSTNTYINVYNIVEYPLFKEVDKCCLITTLSAWHEALFAIVLKPDRMLCTNHFIFRIATIISMKYYTLHNCSETRDCDKTLRVFILFPIHTWTPSSPLPQL